MKPVFTKSPKNPVLGPGIGTCFDVSVAFENGCYRMWFSWRDKKAVGLVESPDGEVWVNPPKIVIAAPSPIMRKLFRMKCYDVSRPCVLFHKGVYHLWYTFHSQTIAIAYAVSKDGKSWKHRNRIVLSPDLPWEKAAVMCPCVIYDEQAMVFKMWYSGGENYEPDAIGYATSKDGITWQKHGLSPVFVADPLNGWEKDRVTAMHVIKENGSYIGFYIGFGNGFEMSSIGMAISDDGIHNWRRYSGNPILTPGLPGEWDDCNIYKPWVICRNGTWMLWYNASRQSDRVEQIGLATCRALLF